MATGFRVTTKNLDANLRILRGKAFKDVNRDLRVAARAIAETIRPEVVTAVRQSRAPQAWPLAGTVRTHSDRVPVVVVGKVNPKFQTPWRRSGQSAAQSKLRRGALAHGVVYGGKGGKRSTPAQENYYKIRRDESGGPVGRSLTSSGRAMSKARGAYHKEYIKVLRRHGFTIDGGRLW